jgi:hypothetical protein
LWIFTVFIPFGMLAQTDTLKSEYQKEFDSFKKDIQQEFETFKNHNDSVFYQFLNDSWKTFELMKDERATVPKPKKQPIIEDARHDNNKIIPLKGKTMLQDSGRQLQLQLVPNNYKVYNAARPYSTIDFYGSKIEVYKAKVKKHSTEPISKSAIAGFFKNTVNNDDLIYSIYDLSGKARHNKLNGWGYLRLLQEASSIYYHTLNERVLFTWTALIKSGFDARVGFDKNNIYLLVNFDVPVYYKLYLVKNNEKYYLIPFNGQQKKSESLTSFQADYPAELSAVGLVINENPDFGKNTKTRKLIYNDQKVNIAYNGNLVDFYTSYPDCELPVYFPPPLSNEALASLDKLLKPKMKNTKNESRVNVLLNFVQYALPYATDDKQFGYENYLFSEETLHYPSADCEDRSILLSQLVNHYTGLDCIGLAYPGHVTLAVNFPASIEGSYVDYEGKRYYICDPTYIGAKCGMLMPEFKNENPEIIEINL